MMTRLSVLHPDQAVPPAKNLLAAVEKKLGLVPNMTRGMAANPVVLEGYLAFAGALSRGKLGARLGELVALTVAEANGCEYCLSAHTAIGGGLQIDAAELDAARDARSSNLATAAALKFARRVVETRGHVGDDDIAAVRAAGYDDAGIGELIALVVLNVFTNYFNSVAATEVDFPRVTPRLKQAA
jgi:uncharacterized peroxidase-related enzyme